MIWRSRQDHISSSTEVPECSLINFCPSGFRWRTFWWRRNLPVTAFRDDSPNRPEDVLINDTSVLQSVLGSSVFPPPVTAPPVESLGLLQRPPGSEEHGLWWWPHGQKQLHPFHWVCLHPSLPPLESRCSGRCCVHSNCCQGQLTFVMNAESSKFCFPLNWRHRNKWKDVVLLMWSSSFISDKAVKRWTNEHLEDSRLKNPICPQKTSDCEVQTEDLRLWGPTQKTSDCEVQTEDLTVRSKQKSSDCEVFWII